MKRSLLYFVFLLFFQQISSQEIMKTHKLEDLSYKALSEKERDSLIVKFNGVFSEDLSDVKFNSQVYLLDDNRVIYDMVDMKIFLFDNIEDLSKFKRIISKIAKTSVKSKIQIKDEKFIDKIDLYTTFFLDNYDLHLDYKNINDLKKIDDLLESFDEKEILKYKNSLVAIIGCFLKENTENGQWSYLRNDPVNNINPVIDCKDGLFQPIYILEDIVFNDKTFFDYLNSLIKNYRRQFDK